MRGRSWKWFVKTFCLIAVVGGFGFILGINYTGSDQFNRIHKSSSVRNRTTNVSSATENPISTFGNISTVRVHTLPDQDSSTQSTQSDLRGWLKDVHWEQGAKLDIYDFSINPVHTCTDGSNNITLLALIKSAPGNAARRDAARKTFISGASKYNVSARFLFVMGDSNSQDEMNLIKEEANTYGDILQVNFHDHYYNLTIKLIMGFKWVLNYCNDIEFLMSVDDDVLVDIVTLVRDLEAFHPKKRSQFVLARRGADLGPHRSDKSKWYMPPELYPDDLYPPFPYGNGYVLSYDVVEKLYLVSKETPAQIPFDDVYCGILLHKLGVEIVDRSPWRRERHPRKRPDYFQIDLSTKQLKSAWRTLEQSL